MWLVIGLAGPVVAFYLLGAASLVFMIAQGPGADDADDLPDDLHEPERCLAWLAPLLCALFLGLADGLLAGLLGGPIARAAGAGAVAGAVVLWPLKWSVLSGFVSLWALALVFATNVVAMALAL